MWGIVPAAGRGSRLQPLAFSKELLPVGSRKEAGIERPCAVSEYLVERMILGGADKICFVISPGKSDIMEYFGASFGSRPIVYVVQPQPMGLCDAVFCAAPVIVCREHLERRRGIRALVINAGNANAGTGARGLEDARAVCAAVAQALLHLRGCGVKHVVTLLASFSSSCRRPLEAVNNSGVHSLAVRELACGSFRSPSLSRPSA